MHASELDAFTRLMKRMATTYGKKLDDELTQAYWVALKDQPLDRITALADHRMKHSRFFPKPVELRPHEERIAPSADGKFEDAELRAVKNLEEMRQKDPVRWLEYLRKHRPGCRAIDYAEEFGPMDIWFDGAQNCWRLL